MRNKKKIAALVLSVIGISVLALAGKQVADRYTRHQPDKINLPVLPAAKDEYSRLVQQFLHPDSVSVVKGTVLLYDGASPERVKEKSDFISVRDGHSYYSKMSFNEIICNGKWYVQVDSLHKQLLIVAMNENQPMAPAPATGDMFDRLFSDTATFKVSGSVAGNDLERVITIKSDLNPEIQYFTLRYSPADYSIKGAEIHFWKDRHAPADTTAIQKSTWITKIEYGQPGKQVININDRINRVFRINGHTIEPTAAYRNYQVSLQ